MQFMRPPGVLHVLAGIGVLFFAGCATLSHNSPLQWTLRNAADSIQVQQHSGTTVLVVTSPSGIGMATLTRGRDPWPTDLRIQLRYAEGRPFTKVEGFYCSVDDQPPVEIGAVTYSTNKTVIRLPTDFLHSNIHTVQLRWVDFYRQ